MGNEFYVTLTNSYCRNGFRKNSEKEILTFQEFILKYFSDDFDTFFTVWCKEDKQPDKIDIYSNKCMYRFLFCDDYKKFKVLMRKVKEEYRQFKLSNFEKFIESFKVLDIQ